MKSLSKNSLFYIIYTTLNVLFPFVTGIYVSHVLLESTVGEVEAARNLVQYFVMFAYLGIPTYGMREIARYRNDKDKLNKVFSELIIINAVSTIIFFILYCIIVLTIPIYSSNYPLYLVMGGLILLNLINITWLFEGLEEFSFICLRNLIFKVVCFILLIVLVRDNGDYLMFAFITVFGVAGNYFLNIFRGKKHATFTFKGLSFKKHLKPILFLTVVNLAIEIYTMVDITMLKIMTDNESVAFYSYGSKIYKIIINVINAFTIVAVPRLSHYFAEKNTEQFNRVISKVFNLILLIAIPSIIGLLFTSDSLITFIYGDSYIRSSHVLKILSIIFVISPVGYLLGSRVLLVSGKENIMIIPVSVGAIINIICNYFLISEYKEMGAAIASVISEFFVAFIYLILSRKKFKLNSCFGNIIKILIASIIMSLILYMIMASNDSSFLTTIKQIVLAGSYYFTVLLLLKEDTVSIFLKKLLKIRKT